MQKKDIPQDPSVLDKFTKDICYAIDENGHYVTTKSRGWEVKATALDITWEDIQTRIEQTKQKVLKGEASPLLFFMELKLIDIKILAAYTGFRKWKIKKHLKPEVFNTLPEKTLKKYAEVFDVPVEVLKNMEVHEA